MGRIGAGFYVNKPICYTDFDSVFVGVSLVLVMIASKLGKVQKPYLWRMAAPRGMAFRKTVCRSGPFRRGGRLDPDQGRTPAFVVWCHNGYRIVLDTKQMAQTDLSREAANGDATSTSQPPLDRHLRAAVGRATRGISPAAIALAWMDWNLHLHAEPEKQAALALEAQKIAARLQAFVAASSLAPGQHFGAIAPLPQDHRFTNEAWAQWPFNLYAQAFLQTEAWWHDATTGIRGVSPANERIVEFTARQALDAVAPSNAIWTNPEAVRQTLAESGRNLVRGWRNWVEDASRLARGARPAGAEAFRPGHEVAATPGKVVFRNRLIELIQYAPATGEVWPEPILIVPAWIMKYYILDLSPGNSLIRYLVGQGFTVFAISWKNPGPEDRDLGLDDYRTLGVLDALDAVAVITGAAKVHGVGYCLGGTLLAIAAAAMGRDGDDRLATVSLFAAQTDFTDAGEIRLFINESQVALLEDMMEEQGYLESSQMAGAFQILRSNDLIWSKMVRDYLIADREPMSDLMGWNADATRLPARMHSEYLRHLFLDNDFAEGRMKVGDHAVVVSDMRAPVFAVGTEWDHVAPWRSVHKLNVLANTDITFVLTNGGHNAGIVSEPGHPNRHFRMAARLASDPYVAPDEWLANTPARAGSWWPAFVEWLGARSGALRAPPAMGAPGAGYAVLGDAPGSYVSEA